MKPLYTPFSTHLSTSAREAELRLRSIFQWKKCRPPVVLLAGVLAVAVGAGSLVGCTPPAPPVPAPDATSAPAVTEAPAPTDAPAPAAPLTAAQAESLAQTLNLLTGWGQGSAGSSLQSVGAACDLVVWAKENAAAGLDKAGLRDAAADWYAAQNESIQPYLAENWRTVSALGEALLEGDEYALLVLGELDRTPPAAEAAPHWAALQTAVNGVLGDPALADTLFNALDTLTAPRDEDPTPKNVAAACTLLAWAGDNAAADLPAALLPGMVEEWCFNKDQLLMPFALENWLEASVLAERLAAGDASALQAAADAGWPARDFAADAPHWAALQAAIDQGVGSPQLVKALGSTLNLLTGWGEGSAGSSLQSVSAAYAMVQWADQNRAEEIGSIVLDSVVCLWRGQQPSEVQWDLSRNWAVVSSLGDDLLVQDDYILAVLPDINKQPITSETAPAHWKALQHAVDGVLGSAQLVTTLTPRLNNLTGWGQGTAGSSIQSALAAYDFLVWCEENPLADSHAAQFVAANWKLAMQDADQQRWVSENWAWVAQLGDALLAGDNDTWNILTGSTDLKKRDFSAVQYDWAALRDALNIALAA